MWPMLQPSFDVSFPTSEVNLIRVHIVRTTGASYYEQCKKINYIGYLIPATSYVLVRIQPAVSGWQMRLALGSTYHAWYVSYQIFNSLPWWANSMPHFLPSWHCQRCAEPSTMSHYGSRQYQNQTTALLNTRYMESVVLVHIWYY